MTKYIVNRTFKGSDGVIQASDKPVEISDDDAPGLLACGAISLPVSEAPEAPEAPVSEKSKPIPASKPVKK